MAVVYVGLGSNLGDREEQVLRAVHEMRAFARVHKISTLHETKPEGNVDQPMFINAVVEISTDYSPVELLEELDQIEETMGRSSKGKGEPREIDLDVLAYDEDVVEEGELKIPHPRMHTRRFVMEPLAELNPDWMHPILKETAQQITDKLPPFEE